MDNNYDVIVVGAGPAGTLTARMCAEKGLKVLVLEKRPEIGSPKRCAEGITVVDLKRIGYKGDECFITYYVKGDTLLTPGGKRIRILSKEGGYILERKLYDKYLAYDAAKAGARIYAKAEVFGLIRIDGKISGVKVLYDGKTREIKGRVVVAADGVESKVARMAGLKTGNTAKSVASGYQYEMANIELEEPHMAYLYWGNDIAPRGYIWIFPKGDHIANVGIGISGNCEKTAKQYLDKWIESRPGIKKGSIIEENAGGIPVGAFLENMVQDNFLAVGDAAHQVNPLHGGGLAESFHSACIASKVINDAIKSDDTSKEAFEPYNKLWWDERGKYLENAERILKCFEKFTDSDLDMIGDTLTGDDIFEMTEGNKARILKIFMKNPRLLTLAKHLR